MLTKLVSKYTYQNFQLGILINSAIELADRFQGYSTSTGSAIRIKIFVTLIETVAALIL